jgi:hypothetical protein
MAGLNVHKLIINEARPMNSKFHRVCMKKILYGRPNNHFSRESRFREAYYGIPLGLERAY